MVALCCAFGGAHHHVRCDSRPAPAAQHLCNAPCSRRSPAVCYILTSQAPLGQSIRQLAARRAASQQPCTKASQPASGQASQGTRCSCGSSPAAVQLWRLQTSHAARGSWLVDAVLPGAPVHPCTCLACSAHSFPRVGTCSSSMALHVRHRPAFPCTFEQFMIAA